MGDDGCMPMTKEPRKRRQCGSNSGYRQHQKRGEIACQACKRAHAEWHFAYRHGLERPKAPRRRTAGVIRREQMAVWERLMEMTDAEVDACLTGEDVE